ncbi:MAG: PD40 domain-containing protein [Candidatus Sericytochromatia bacterium]|nr:PD40 domain-containing protein [Candidatus Sericytochromatia bacterium]
MPIKCLLATALASMALALPAVAQSFEVGQDVILEQDGKWLRGWVLQPDGKDHYLVGLNWSANHIQRVQADQLRPNSSAPISGEKKQIEGWQSTEGTLWGLAASADGQYLAAGAAAGWLQMFDQRTLYPRQRIPAFGKAIFGLAFSPDGQTLAACSYDGQLRLFDSRSAEVLQQQSLPGASSCEELAFSSQGVLALSGRRAAPDGQHALWLYDTQQQRFSAPLLSAASQQKVPTALTFSPDGQKLAVGFANRQKGVGVYQVQNLNLKPLQQIPSAADIQDLAFHPKGEFLAVAEYSGELSLLKWASMQRFWRISWRGAGSSAAVNRVRFAPDGQSLAACGQGLGPPVQRLRFGNGTRIQSHGEDKRSMNCTGLVFGADGRAIYTSRQVFSNFNEKILDRYALP